MSQWKVHHSKCSLIFQRNEWKNWTSWGFLHRRFCDQFIIWENSICGHVIYNYQQNGFIMKSFWPSIAAVIAESSQTGHRGQEHHALVSEAWNRNFTSENRMIAQKGNTLGCSWTKWVKLCALLDDWSHQHVEFGQNQSAPLSHSNF